MVAKVKLFAREMKWCQQHAEKIVNHYGGHGSKGSGAYNHNKISSNLVGVKSEKATVIYLKRFIPLEDIEENYIDFTNSSLIGDLNIYGQSIEIKVCALINGTSSNNSSKTIKTLCSWWIHCGLDDGFGRYQTLYGKTYGLELRSRSSSQGVDVQTICANVG